MATLYPFNAPPIKNTSGSFEVSLVDQDATSTFKANPTLAAGDVTRNKDGGSFGNITSLPTAIDSGKVLTVTLTADERNADRICVLFSDAAGDQWQDLLVTINTVAATTVSDFDESADEVDIGAVKGAGVAGVDDFKADVTGMSTLVQADILNDATPFAGANIDETISAPKALTAAYNAAKTAAQAGDLMGLADDAITLAKYDETTAFALQSVDTGSTQVARTGADSDTLETLSDQIDAIMVLLGAHQVTLQLYETGTTTPIADVTVSVKNSDQSLLLGVVETDSNGQATFGRNDGTYKLLCEKSGFTFTTPETLTVAGVDVSQTIYGTAWTAPVAPTVYTCIVYGWVKDVDNTALADKTVSAKIGNKPVYYSGVGYTAIQSASDTTDDNGYFELTLTRSRYLTAVSGVSGNYTLTIAEAGIVWTCEVPDSSSAKFDDCRV